MVIGNEGDCLPVKFFGERRVHMIGAQPRLHVRHGNFSVKSRKRGGKRRGGVPLHHDKIGLLCAQKSVGLVQDPRGHVRRSKTFFHHVHIKIGFY